MKYIVVFLILFSGFSGVRAQDAYEQFRTEMKKLETREREYHSVIFGKNDYPEHYKEYRRALPGDPAGKKGVCAKGCR